MRVSIQYGKSQKAGNKPRLMAQDASGGKFQRFKIGITRVVTEGDFPDGHCISLDREAAEYVVEELTRQLAVSDVSAPQYYNF